MKDNNISILWDFDGTLLKKDSTNQVIEFFNESSKTFWTNIHALTNGDQKHSLEHILASDAPIWMYSLSELASETNTPLNKEFFNEMLKDKIELYHNVIPFLQTIKQLEKGEKFKKNNIKIHHFIVSAGLKDLIEICFPEGLIERVYGCRYAVVEKSELQKRSPNKVGNIPIFCMDETMKTRAIFEISKGIFKNQEISVNKKVLEKDLWSPFKDMIYIGDGPTDIPALSLVRSQGGMGVAVYDKDKSEDAIYKKTKDLSLDERTDLITPADYSLGGELFKFIESRCNQILQRYEAAYFCKKEKHKLCSFL